MSRPAARVRLTGLAAEMFLLFCMAVYFGCCIGFSLLNGVQLLVIGLMFLLGMEAVWIPFSFAAIRARVHPETGALYYYDGCRRYFYAVGLQILSSLMRFGAAILWLPGAGCMFIARAAYAQEFGVTALVLCLCGGLLWICAAIGTGVVWHRVGRWKRRKIT